MQYITDIISTIVVFLSGAVIIIAILNFILKMRILHLGYKDESFIKHLTQTIEYKHNSLKWAILLFFAGVGLVTIYLLPLTDPVESPLTYGIMCISLSVGFFIYYIIVRNDKPVS
jgi:hypothetical protein